MERLIYVTLHAIEQFQERWPELPFQNDRLMVFIANEVESAFTDCRYSTKEPKWAQKKEGSRSVGRRNWNGERDRTLRYCWTENEDRVYLVDRQGKILRVITSIFPDSLSP